MAEPRKEHPDDPKPKSADALRQRKIDIRSGKVLAPPRDELPEDFVSDAQAELIDTDEVVESDGAVDTDGVESDDAVDTDEVVEDDEEDDEPDEDDELEDDEEDDEAE